MNPEEQKFFEILCTLISPAVFQWLEEYGALWLQVNGDFFSHYAGRDISWIEALLNAKPGHDAEAIAEARAEILAACGFDQREE